jgi:hypothetical protein
MLMDQSLLLAQSSGQDLISTAILVILLVGGAIFNWVVKMMKERQEGGGKGKSKNSAGRAEQLARRKAEMQRQMQAQRGASGRPGQNSRGGVASGGGDEPGNMTMAERIARARAKHEYEQRRSQQGGPSRPGQSSPQRSSPSRETSPSDAEARREAQRHAAEQRQQAIREKQAAQARQRQEQQRQAARRQAQQSQPSSGSRQQPASSRGMLNKRSMPIGSARRNREVLEPVDVGPRRVAEPVDPTNADVAKTEVGMAGVGKVRQRSTGRSLINFNRLSNDDLRRMVILKEVIDKPVAIRDPLAEVGR